MPTLEPLDREFPIFRQLQVPESPVVLVNLFTVAAAEEAEFLQVWRDDAHWMQRSPGSSAPRCTAPSATASCT